MVIFGLVVFLFYCSIGYGIAGYELKDKNYEKNAGLGAALFFVISVLWPAWVSERIYGKLVQSCAKEANQNDTSGHTVLSNHNQDPK